MEHVLPGGYAAEIGEEVIYIVGWQLFRTLAQINVYREEFQASISSSTYMLLSDVAALPPASP